MFNDVKDIAKHASVYGIADLLKKGIGFLMIPIYTHYLGPADYGLLELLDLTLEVVGMIVGLRFGASLMRYYHHYDYKNDKEEVFTTALLFTVVTSVILLIVLELFSQQIATFVSGGVEHQKAFQIIFLCLAIQNIYLVSETYILTQKKSVLYSSLSTITLLLGLSMNIVFVVIFELGVYGILLSMLIVKSINMIIVVPITTKAIKFRFSYYKLIEMLKFGLPLIPVSIAMFVMHFSDRFFIQKFCSLEDLGPYSLAYKFGMIISVLVMSPFFKIWNTQRFEISKRNDAKSRFGKMLTYFSLLIVFFGLGISVFSEEIINLMAPKAFAAAASIAPIIVCGYILYGFSNFFTIGIMVTYNTKFLAVTQLSSAVLNVLSNWIMISKWGLIGAAFSTVLTFFFLTILNYLVSQKLYHIVFEYRKLSVIFLFALAIYLLSTLFVFQVFLSIAAKLLIICFYPVLLWLAGVFTEKEINKIKEISYELFEKLYHKKKTV